MWLNWNSENIWSFSMFLLFVCLLFCFACSFKWNKQILGLTWHQNGRLPTRLMVNAPPTHNSLKDYSLHAANKLWGQLQTKHQLHRIDKTGVGGGWRGGGSTLTYLSDEVRHLFLTAAYILNRNVKLCLMLEPWYTHDINNDTVFTVRVRRLKARCHL